MDDWPALLKSRLPSAPTPEIPSFQWKRKTTPGGRLVWQIMPSTLPIDATGCGSPLKPWATPQARDGTPRGAQGARFLHPDRSNDLPDEVAFVTAAEAAGLWATPIANDAEKRGVPVAGAGLAGQVHIGTMPPGSADATAKPGGSLSSAFVAWLMGYPPEYLACAPETAPKKSA